MITRMHMDSAGARANVRRGIQLTKIEKLGIEDTDPATEDVMSRCRQRKDEAKNGEPDPLSKVLTKGIKSVI